MSETSPRNQRRAPIGVDRRAETPNGRPGSAVDADRIATVLSTIPSVDHLVSASHEGRRSGTIVRWVQRCGLEPPMVLLVMRKGHPIEPLIRDSRAFAVIQLSPAEALLRRLFATEHACGDDPFLSLPVRCTSSGSPVPLRAVSYLDCELLRHFDIECDHEIYVGLIRGAGVLASCGQHGESPPEQRATRSA